MWKRKYAARGGGGLSMAISAHWGLPSTPGSGADKKAAESFVVDQFAWMADPVVKGDYPKVWVFACVFVLRVAVVFEWGLAFFFPCPRRRAHHSRTPPPPLHLPPPNHHKTKQLLRDTQPWLPAFSAQQRADLKGSVTFLALNYYTAHYITAVPSFWAKYNVRCVCGRAAERELRGRARARARARALMMGCREAVFRARRALCRRTPLALQLPTAAVERA